MTKNLLPAIFILLNIQISNAQSGTLDASFGNGGIILNTMGSSSQYADIAFQGDGKILCGGTANAEAQQHPVLIRYDMNGQPDNTFGNNGIAFLESFYTPVMQVNDITVQSDGAVFIAGVDLTEYSELADFFVIKLQANGLPDSSFNGTGIVRTQLGLRPFGEMGDILLQSDGKVIITGYAYNEFYESSFLAIRYYADGNIDDDFGVNGVATIQPGVNGDNRCTTTALQADGKIVFAGSIDFDYFGDFAFVRLNQDGSLDNTFGTNGVSIVDNAGNTDLAIKVILQPDGKIVACGTASEGSNTPTYRAALIRLNADGSPDAEFGNNGIAFPVMNDLPNFMYDVTLQDDGKLVCAGSVYKDGGVFEGGRKSVLLVRYNPDGTPDVSLGGNGVQITPIDSNGDSEGYSVGLFNNRIYIAGRSLSGDLIESGFVAAYRQKNTVLPVRLLQFSATRKSDANELSWQAEMQLGIVRYNVERSNDGVEFEQVGAVAAFNTERASAYSFRDAVAGRKDIYYRLQLMGRDNQHTYSRVVRLAGENNISSLKVYPNPASSVLQVMINGITDNASLKLIDVNGKVVRQMRQALSGNTTLSIDINTLAPGVYTLVLYSAGELKQQKFIKM